jgi:phage terminase large subunit
MMKLPDSNLLVTRKVYNTLKKSCFTELKWAIARFGVSQHWKVIESPLEMTYIPTGQKIYFQGLDNPLKTTSITVESGSLCWEWVEEAYEISNEEDFNTIDESIRGRVAEGLFKQITLTFNPWNEKHWLKKRFFDNPNPDILAMTTNYLCNEWIDESDKNLFENMRANNPRRYKVAGLGDWGIVAGLIYDNFLEERFEFDVIKKISGIKSVFGLDFGYTNDPSALFCGLLDVSGNRLFVFDEMYGYGMSNRRIFEQVSELGYVKELIVADSAEPKSIDELYDLGMRNIRSARKGRDSVAHGIQFLQGFEIIVHPRCVNFLREISMYMWEIDKSGNKLNRPVGSMNHLMDAMRYAVESHSKGDTFSFD